MTESTIKVEISPKTVLFTVGTLIALWVLVKIQGIIILVFLSVILLSALLKPVEWLTTKKIPRILAAIIVYLIMFSTIGIIISIIVPPLISQTTEFVTRLPQIIGSINAFLVFNQIPTQNITAIINNAVQSLGKDLVSITTRIFQSFVLLITLFVLTFYLILDWKNIISLISSPFAGKYEKKVRTIVSNVEKGLGGWVRGQLTLSVTIGLFTYIGLAILNFPFALPLSIIAGVLEIIPIIGPIISAIPAFLVGLSITPVLGFAAIVLFIIVHQFENHLVVPLVMSKVVGLQPPLVIIALLVGAKLAGIEGASLAIPVIVVAKIIVQELMPKENLEEK